MGPNEAREASAPEPSGFRGAVQVCELAVVVAATAFVLVYPFTQSHYPAMCDLPFHAAFASIFRHYLDPAFHFREQFALHFLRVPYLTFHVLGAALAWVFTIATAIKLAAIVHLACLPAGVAVLCWGQKKSPLLGWTLGLLWVWNALTHFGFLNYTAAVGLSCMAVGITLRLADAPTRGRALALAAVLVGVLVSHLAAFPSAALAVAIATAFLYPATRRYKEPLLALLPALSLFALWYLFAGRHQPTAQALAWQGIDLHRLSPSLVEKHAFFGFKGDEERGDARLVFAAVATAFLVGAASFLVEHRARAWTARERLFARGATTTLLACVLGCALLYVTLPETVDNWYWVYPREVLPAALLCMALVPDLPRSPFLRLALLLGLLLPGLKMAALVGREYARFDGETQDFQRITRALPKAPRLAYLIFDHQGTGFYRSPFVHLPAWVQAETGGWLSFHFASNEHGPIQYRAPSDDVPPSVPHHAEWRPQKFDFVATGRFFDFFLVRSAADPAAQLAADPSLKLTEHVGKWWLYRRAVAPPT